MKVVGSTALKRSNLHRLEPKDLDTWTFHGEFQGFSLPGDNYIVSQKIYDLIPTIDGLHATPDAVYTIKCSHFAYDIKWDKTKKDILWLKHKGCKLLPDLYKALKKQWKIDYGNKSFLSLKQKKADFFNDHVTYVYDHDYLHSIVSYPDFPIYHKCLAENESVLIDKTKFFALPFNEQLQMFKEEITVIALERWVIPKKASWHTAYSLALKKTITNLTKNWATDFIISNLDYYSKAEYKLFNFALEKLQLKENNMNDLQNMIVALHKELDIETNIQELVFQLSENELYLRPKPTSSLSAEDCRKILDKWGYETISTEGGGEGGAESCVAIFKLKDKIIRTEYQYYSHHGYDYDNILYTMKEVTPVQKTVTIYE